MTHRAEPLTTDEQALLDLLHGGGHVRRDNPLTQEEAGAALGFAGKRETVRRRVQKLRESIETKTGRLICASSAEPPGMWIGERDEDLDEYFRQVHGRALNGLLHAKRIDARRTGKLMRDLYRDIGADERQESDDAEPVPDADVPCKAALRPGQHPEDLSDAPNGKRCWCGRALRGRQEKYCGDFHAQLWHGRVKAS